MAHLRTPFLFHPSRPLWFVPCFLRHERLPDGKAETNICPFPNSEKGEVNILCLCFCCPIRSIWRSKQPVHNHLPDSVGLPNSWPDVLRRFIYGQQTIPRWCKICACCRQQDVVGWFYA